MEIAKVKVTGTRAETIKALDIPQGIVGTTVSFEFGPEWAGLTKNVVFVGAKDVEVLSIQDSVYLPPEVVSAPNIIVKVGIVGVDANKKMVIPTLWADLGTVKPGAPVGMGYEPTLPIWAQLMGMIGDLRGLNTADKSNLVAAINEAMSKSGTAGGYYTPVVTQPTTDTMKIAFVPSVATMPAVEPVTITLPGSDSGQNPTVEPAEDDIPKVFFGGALQQTKDEKVVPFRYISKTQDFSGYAEIKAQGNSSMSYPKKNQTVKLYKDADCTEKLKVDYKGWGKQNKHCYKANWIDLTHARNVVSARLWADVVKSRANYAELPELLRTSPNQGAVDGFPVKVYADGVYQGRYTLNIPKDKWTFNMDDELDEHCVLCGENYVSGCFRAAAKIDETDWTDEIHDVVPASIKTRWNQVIAFVMNSTDEEFLANLGQYFYVDSLIDYYLFGLASCGLDAFGKNQIYATYDGQRWIASMYDMDSTWGLYWNGSKFVATDYARTSYEDYVSSGSGGEGNLLYNRLEQLFWSELQTRWAELKNGALSIENIINRFERFTDIAPAELVKEDYASTTGGGKFTGIPSQNTNNIQQIRSFALARQAWTDSYVTGLTPAIPVPCTGISLDKSTLTFTADGTQTLAATVTPDGCTDPIFWESNNNSIATVENGAVTAIANGNATITARCGDYSASCNVSVSGIVEPVPCTGIVLSQTSIVFADTNPVTLTATLEPADTTDTVVWASDNDYVATVAGGVVTPTGKGSTVITATAGAITAECGVTVDVDMPVPDVKVVLNLQPKHTLSIETGEFTEDQYSWHYGTKEYISVPPNRGIMYPDISTGTASYIAFYDENKTFISGVEKTPGAYAEVPDTAKYFRYSNNNVNAEQVSVIFTNPIQQSWNAGKKIDSSGAVIDGNDFVSDIITLPDDAICVILRNTNGGAFKWLCIAEYDSDNGFIKKSSSYSGTNETVAVLSESCKQVRGTAYLENAGTKTPAELTEFIIIAR